MNKRENLYIKMNYKYYELYTHRPTQTRINVYILIKFHIEN